MAYTSYAYDPTGQRVDVSIKDGQTYTSDGNRIGEGYTVQTNGGIYKMEGGKGVLVDSHNQAVQPVTPQAPPVDMGAMAQDVGNFYQQSSDSYLKAQEANFQRQLGTQITELEKSYADAIAEGSISVRDAQAQFDAQKKQIEADAYRQHEMTKGQASEMGLSNSQQMVGIATK